MDFPDWLSERAIVFQGRFVFEELRQLKIGRGGFSTVYKGFDKHHKLPIAVKFIDFENSHGSDEQKEIDRELDNLCKIGAHDNIVAYLGHDTLQESTGNNPLCIFLELCNGDLSKLIAHRQKVLKLKFHNSEIEHILGQISSGVCHLHAKNIWHRDLKPKNVLLKYDTTHSNDLKDISVFEITFKVSDFGLSRVSTDNTSSLTHGVGTRIYTAPEVKQRNSSGTKYDSTCDSYSLGIIGIELCTFQRPETKEDIVKVFRDFSMTGFAKLFQELLHHDPKRRKTVSWALSCLKDSPTRILVTGGFNEFEFLSDVEVITIPSPSGTIEDGIVFDIKHLPIPLTGHCLLGNHLIGGLSDRRTVSNKVFQLKLRKSDSDGNVVEGDWEEREGMMEGRCDFDGFADEEKKNAIQIWGGEAGGGRDFKSSEVLSSGEWRRAEDELPFETYGHTVTRIKSKGIDVLLGGAENERGIWTRKINESGNEWKNVGNELRCERLFHSSFEFENTIIIVGGFEHPTRSEIVSLETFQSEEGPELPMEFNARGSVIRDKFNRIYLLGSNAIDRRIMEFKNGEFKIVPNVELKMARDGAACVDLDTIEIN